MKLEDLEFGQVVTLNSSVFRFAGNTHPTPVWPRNARMRYWQIRSWAFSEHQRLKYERAKVNTLGVQGIDDPIERANLRVAYERRVEECTYDLPEEWMGEPASPEIKAYKKVENSFELTPRIGDMMPWNVRYRRIGIPSAPGVIFRHITKLEGFIKHSKDENGWGGGYRFVAQRKLPLVEVLVKPGWKLRDWDPDVEDFPRILLATLDDVTFQKALF